MPCKLDALLRLRMAPPTERYQRIADRGAALEFAANLADAVGVAVTVYHGAGFETRRRSRSVTPGFVVAMADDPRAAIAAGAGRRVETVGDAR